MPLCLLAAVLTGSPGPARADEAAYQLPGVLVEGEEIKLPQSTTLLTDDPFLPPSADGGELLRSVPGVTAGRMGGHGLEPVIRGQQQNRLNILNDGAYIFGGCPNRMDPPTAYVPVETFDKVTVLKGYQSVQYGPGGTGGTVLFERDRLRFSPEKMFQGRIGGGVESNGFVRDAFADLAAGAEQGYARAIGAWKEADNYDDGSGNPVRSAFKTKSGDVTLAWTPDQDSFLSLGFTADRERDVLFAGAGMDTPKTDANTVRLKASREFHGAFASAIRTEGYWSKVDHVMDNYSLRPLDGAMPMRAPSDSRTAGGRIVVDVQAGGAPLSIGVDAQDNLRDARRYRGMSPFAVDQLQSILWPDVNTRQIGVFAEGTWKVAAGTRLKLGVRYDHVRADAGAADRRSVVTGRSPNDLYRAYYGVTASTATEDNLGGLVRLEHDLSSDTTLFAGVSRSVRTADATERFLASDMMATSWVGNPRIEPEAHYQLDLGATLKGSEWSLTGSLYADRVTDFILRDTARRQPGILLANGATIYRNVDALLSGGEIGGKYRPWEHWLVTANLAYVYGQNLDTDRPLAQIPPLQGTLEVVYEETGWALGGRLRGAATQGRVDSNPALGSGLDVRKTPGFAVFDLFGSVTLVSPVEVRLGVTNLFDETYAYHLNQSSLFDPTEVQVNEPGRSVYLQIRVPL